MTEKIFDKLLCKHVQLLENTNIIANVQQKFRYKLFYLKNLLDFYTIYMKTEITMSPMTLSF